MGWIEVNIGLENRIAFLNDVLLGYVFSLVDSHREGVESWHFLWQSRPWPEVEGSGTTLRLRFLAEDEYVERLRSSIDNSLNRFENENRESYLGHCFGRHGVCGEEFEGGEEKWGSAQWRLVAKILHFASETAMELIENRDQLGRSEEWRRGISEIADRYTHLFLNCLAKFPFDEVQFLLEQAIQRIAIRTVGATFSSAQLASLIEEIQERVQDEASANQSVHHLRGTILSEK